MLYTITINFADDDEVIEVNNLDTAIGIIRERVDEDGVTSVVIIAKSES